MSALLAATDWATAWGAQAQPPTVPPVDEVSTGETVVFWILGPIALAGALGMIFARNAVHSALWLVLTMLCLGMLYLTQQAPFLGFVQIIVYTGAIMMLFLFVLMLVGRDSSDSVVEVLRGQRIAGAALGIGLAALVVASLVRSLSAVEARGLSAVNGAEGGNVGQLGREIFTTWLFPFELTSALLITAAIGAMVLAFAERKPGSKPTQRELVEARFRGTYERPSPLPGPGVFATANSVATPALLPDGSPAPESVSELIAPRDRASLRGDEASVAGTLPGPDAHALTGTPTPTRRSPRPATGTPGDEAAAGAPKPAASDAVADDATVDATDAPDGGTTDGTAPAGAATAPASPEPTADFADAPGTDAPVADTPAPSAKPAKPEENR